MICHVCGSDLPARARFCPACARPVAEAPVARSIAEPMPAANGPRPTAHALPRDELAATVAARRELGGGMDADIPDAFLARIEHDLDVRVDERLRRGGGSTIGQTLQRGGVRANRAFGLALGSIALSIPLTAISGAIIGLPGVIAVWTGVSIVNIAYNRGRDDTER